MRSITRRRRAIAAAVFSGAFAGLGFRSNPVLAVDRSWVGGDGSWQQTAHWTGSAVPIAGDDAFIISGANLTVVRDASTPSYSAPGPAHLRLDGTGAAVVTLSQSANDLFVGTEYVGWDGRAVFSQNGGNNFVGTTLFLGVNPNSSGTYNLNTTGTLSAVTEIIANDNNAQGLVNHSAGTNAISGELRMAGFSSTSFATYLLSGGTLTAGSLTIGDRGHATFTQTGGITQLINGFQVGTGSQSSGVASVTGGTLNFGGNGNVRVGSTSGAAGTLIVGGSGTVFSFGGSVNVSDHGTLLVSGSGAVSGETVSLGTGAFAQQTGGLVSADRAFIGGGATYNISGGILFSENMVPMDGLINQNGGTVHFESGVEIGSIGTGVYNLSDGTLKVGGIISTVFLESGTLTQSGGYLVSLDPSEGVRVNALPAKSAQYNMNGGSVSVGLLEIGAGTISQSGGTINTGSAIVGSSTAGPGTYLRSGGTLIASSLTVGDTGQGTFSQTAGYNRVSGEVHVGSATGSSGVLSVSGGTLEMPLLDLTVGGAGGGNGTLAVSGTGNVFLGGGNYVNVGNHGTMNVSGGLVFSEGLSVGSGGFVQQSGGLVSTDRSAVSTGGTYQISGGSWTSENFVPIDGVVNQTGGRVRITDRIDIGMTGTGLYTLNNGTLDVRLLLLESGTLLQSGGTVLVGPLAEYVAIDAGPAKSAFYGMSGGTMSTPLLQVGSFGTGTLSQNGGTISGGSIVVGVSTAGVGTYLLASGNMSTNFMAVGDQGHGVYSQSGGLATAISTLLIGNGSLSAGTVSVSGGTLAVPMQTTVGSALGGSGVLNVSGNGTFFSVGNLGILSSGTANISGGLLFANLMTVLGHLKQIGGALSPASLLVGSGGIYDLSGGSFQGGGVRLDVGGPGVPGIVNQTGGEVHNLTDQVRIGVTSTIGVYNLSNGSINTGTLEIGDAGFGTLNQTGGSISAPLVIIGGVATGAGSFIQNHATLSAVATFATGQLFVGGLTPGVGSGLWSLSNGAVANVDNITIGRSGTISLSASTLNASSMVNSNRYTQVSGAATLGNVTEGAPGNGFLNITGGTLTANSIQQTTVSFSGTGSARLTAKGTPNSPTGTSKIKALSFAGANQLDLADNALILDYDAPIGSLLNSVRQGIQAGNLTSSSATATRRIGFGDNAALGFSSFAGLSVDSSSVLIAFTFAGDANLDSKVDIRDLIALALHFNASAQSWTSGDFNYDGLTNATDLGMLAHNWHAGTGAPAQPLSAALQSLGLPDVDVPEPAVLPLAVASLGWLRRRNRIARG